MKKHLLLGLLSFFILCIIYASSQEARAEFFQGWMGKCTSGSNCDTANQHSIGFGCTAATCSGLGSGSGDGQFSNPHNVAVYKAARIYVADAGNNRIQVFDPDGNFLFKFGSFGTANGKFNFPGGIAADRSGRALVADTSNHRIQVFDPDGNFLFKFGSVGSGNGQFNAPRDVAADSDRNIYVADGNNHRIQVFTSAGSFLFTFGTPCYIPTGMSCVDPDGPGPLQLGDGQFWDPEGLTVDDSGKIYVADQSNRNVQVFNSTGGFLFKFGSVGIGEGEFLEANDVAVDNTGNIYVVDLQAHQIQKFDPMGSFLLKFGSTATPGSGNGQFNGPTGLTIDSANKIYVADQSNDRIQLVLQGGCLIATAAFGSELSPQVQFLRDFRDDHILSTHTGTSFMNVFNAWYYSFSPYVAEYEREHPWFQQTVKIAIYPLLGVLHVAKQGFSLIGGEYGAISSGLISTSMIGAVYLSPLALSIRQVRDGKLNYKLTGLIITALLAAVMGSVLLGNQTALITTGLLFLLSILTVSALLTARMVMTFKNKVQFAMIEKGFGSQ